MHTFKTLHKLLFALLVLLLFACPIVLFAQTEEWDTYLATSNGKPMSVLVDMALHNSAPNKLYPYVVITGPLAQTPSKNGIPNKQEITDLEQILDVTSNFITGVTAKILAGTVTYNNQRLNYYYVKDTTAVRNAIKRVYTRNFKGYNHVITIKQDAEWLNYLTFLYPDETTQNWMENNKVITRLLTLGDTLQRKRNISFAACFANDSARTKFSDRISTRGFELQKKHKIKTSPMSDCVIFSRYSTIEPDSIAHLTTEIKREVKAYGGTYNGWDASNK